MVVALTVLAGCATTEGRSDAYESLKARQAAYCAEASPMRRAAVLAVIRSQVPEYPPSGLCTDAEQALAEEVARQAAKLPEGATVDLEQAQRDQERFRDED